MRRGARHLAITWFAPAAMAVQLLTRVPLPVAVPWNDAVGRRSVVFYPLAGAVVGLLLGAGWWAFGRLLPPFPAAALLTALWVWVTGALHLDGWMDTADAFGSNRPRERMLEIMKDPRVGAMGVAAGGLLLLTKAAFLTALFEFAAGGSLHVGAAAAVVPVLARAFVPWAIVGWPYAGGAGGMGAVLRTAGRRHAWASAAVAAGCAALLLAGFGGGDAAMLLPLAMAGALLVAVAGVLGAVWMSRRLGGLTGDSYGALIEGLEATLLLALVLLGNAS
ncbi:adenosylcobinamide-GDP ribazoletransferase [Paenibacillus sp. TRM 82003]|nr:adenosylcobinamide-GDP ribazoletransferase [Paenibacillus sp. TRM 82003]